jgi:hypothetical protein
MLLQYLGRAPEGMSSLTSKLRTLENLDSKSTNENEISSRIGLKLQLTERWRTRAETANTWFFHIMGGAYTLPSVDTE